MPANRDDEVELDQDELVNMFKEMLVVDVPQAELDKTEENLVKGCQSQVWLIATEKEGNVYFEADSDAIISKGICALLVKVFNGQPASEIVKNNLGFIDEIGLKEHLSPNRSNGLVAMIKKIKAFALVFSNT